VAVGADKLSTARVGQERIDDEPGPSDPTPPPAMS
jgi:hypothetical protein